MAYVGLNEIACLPPAPDRSGLAQFEAIATVASSVITAAGALASAKISSDAQKYAIKKQTQADLQIALARQKAELDAQKAQIEAQQMIEHERTEQNKVTAQARTEQTAAVTSIAGPLLALAVAGGVALIILKHE